MRESLRPTIAALRVLAVRIGVTAALLGALALAGCETEPGPSVQLQPPKPLAAMPWTAAIGELNDGTSELHCSAVLVARNVIATAAHCLFLETSNRPAAPNDLIFRPNMGGIPALPPSRGIAFKALGGVIRAGRIRNEDVPNDWALIAIDPPVVNVQPVPVAGLPIAGMLNLVQSGDRLVTAGYGNGSYDELKLHDSCRIIPQQELGIFPDDATLLTDCVFRVGDSGGAIVLVDGAGQPALVGIITGFGRKPRSTDPLGLGANAANFLPYLRGPIAASPVPTTITDLTANLTRPVTLP